MEDMPLDLFKKRIKKVLIEAEQNKSNRILQIDYASGLKMVIDQTIQDLDRSSNLIKFNLLRENYKEIKNEPKKQTILKSLLIKILSFIFGLHPVIGAIIFAGDIVKEVVEYNISKSELLSLKGQLSIHSKPKKKYKKIRHIVIVPNLEELSERDAKFLLFLVELINKKYISKTLLIIFQNKNENLLALSGVKNRYSFDFDENDIKTIVNTDKTISKGFLQILDFIGLQYLETLSQLLEDNPDSKTIIKRIIETMINNASVKQSSKINKKDFNRFMKICSILFDQFYLIDIEYTTNQDNTFVKPLDMLEQGLMSGLISEMTENSPLTYSFIEAFIREFYQNESSIIIESNTYRKIYDYLTSQYPNAYAEIALLTKLLGKEEDITFLYCLKAYYYQKDTIEQHKLNKIKGMLNNNSTGRLYLELYNYSKGNYKNKNYVLNKCYEMIEVVYVYSDYPESQLCIMNTIASLVYELENNINIHLKVIEIYRNIFTKLKIFSENYLIYNDYIVDAIVFSTCIENDYSTQVFAQKLLCILDLDKLLDDNLAKSLRILRLGNALYPSNILKGMQLTRRAFVLSSEFFMEHELSKINYSFSLIICAKYQEAMSILSKSNAIDLLSPNIQESIANNFFIAQFFSSKRPNRKKFLDNFKNLYHQDNPVDSSDKMIIKNNYVGAYILNNYKKSAPKIEQLLFQIIKENDNYHSFFSHQNLLILYYLTGNKPKFDDIEQTIKLPLLLISYDNFFKDRTQFLKNHFGDFSSIDYLWAALKEWQSICYPEDQYVHYTYPILFGLIERWFE